MENTSEVIEAQETAQIETPIAIIGFDDIATVDYAGRKIRYAILADGTAVISAYDIFTIMFSGSYAYPHLESIEQKGIDAIEGNGQSRKDKFFTLQKIHERFLEFNIPTKTYQEKPQNYEGFVSFVNAGGVQLLADQIGLNAKFKPKDLSHLPIASETPQKAEPQKEESGKDEILQALKSISKDFKTLDTNQRAFEEVTQNTLQNFKEGIESLAKSQSQSIEALKQSIFEQKQALQAQIEQNKLNAQSELENAKAQAIEAIQDQNGIDPIRVKFTNSKVWLRIAIAVTLIFLPFTFMGLHKYIAIEAENWLASFGVGLLCFLIALVWDGAIFLFTINGKQALARFGSFVQLVFFSAKFDFIKIVVSDMGADGDYWQKMAVILCAVIYSPLLLSQIADLSLREKTDKEV